MRCRETNTCLRVLDDAGHQNYSIWEVIFIVDLVSFGDADLRSLDNLKINQFAIYELV